MYILTLLSKKIWSILTVLLLTPFFSVLAEAPGRTVPRSGSLYSIVDFFVGATGIFLDVLGVASILIIIIGGAYMAFSGGEPGKVATGKKMVIYAIIGLTIAYFSNILVNWVDSFF